VSRDRDVRWVAVGRVARAHGVKGEVAVLPLSEVEARFREGSRLFVGEGSSRTLTVVSSRPHRQRLLVTFEELRDRAEAEALGGAYLFVPSDSSPSLPPGQYWPHQLVGCEVETAGGRALGRCREVIHTPANDVWAIEGADGSEVLIPALKDVVRTVDIDAGRIVVEAIPGLVEP